MSSNDRNSASCTRRSLVRVAGGAVVLAPSFVTVASGQTSSGNAELQTTSTIPTNTAIDITIYEDEDGDGTAERSQTKSLTGGTDEITEFSQLKGDDSTAWTYWMDVSLSTNDSSSTPELDSATITLPEGTTETATSEPQVSDPSGTTLPLEVNFRNMQTGTSLFLVGVLSSLFGVSYLFRNPAAGITTAFAIVVLIMSGLFGLTLEVFWLVVLMAAILVVVGLAARWAT